MNSENTPTDLLTQDNSALVIGRLKQQIIQGKHWYLALLEAIGEWSLSEEIFEGRRYQYLISGEAFDLLLLAERLSGSAADLLPEDEMLALLFDGQPPLELADQEFKALIGVAKHRQYLNYYYGVIVEEAIRLAVQMAVRKERRVAGYGSERDILSEVYRRIYGTTRGVLLKRFRLERGYPRTKSISLGERKEFTYWLFKYRLKQCDRARIASDTNKGLRWLTRNGFERLPFVRRGV